MFDSKAGVFSPRAFLKARRPERFSDTITEERTEVDRSLLEFQLDSLTSRSQETDFQRFAHALCSRTICPNLLPQTGPTGGGDSKVDAETYPVAEDLALTWSVGVASGAERERWAFAFSAKKDWQPKLASDIAKIAKTDRRYVKAFFVTNQAVSDKKRAEQEDKLRKKHGLDIRILDRTWIMDRVFEGRLEHLAAEELKLTTFSRKATVKGPRDARREERLLAVEQRLRESVAGGGGGLHLPDLSLEAAILVRELDRPREEVVARFRAVEEMARKHGADRQRVEAACELAWTLFWWHEDYAAFAEQYGVVESLARDSRNAYDLERLANLWQLLRGAVAHGDLDAAAASATARTGVLVAALERLSGEVDRPSTALQAEALLRQVRLTEALRDGQSPDEHFAALREIVARSKGLVGFPLESLVDIVRDLGDLISGSLAYDALFEEVVELSAANDGEARAARLLLERGTQQIAQGRPVDAIATLGRALARLQKHETRHELVRALYLCGCAYDDIGLPWAARGTLLTAASIATDELWRYGRITPYQASCYRRLKWLELRLGRLPRLLAWHEADLLVRADLAERGYDRRDLFSSDAPFQGVLGQLLLRADLRDLRELGGLPPVLDRLGLVLSADALLFALGYEDRLRDAPSDFGSEPAEVARYLSGMEHKVPLAARPDLCATANVAMASNVVGCRIQVECENDDPCLEIAQSILAMLESFLATSGMTRAFAMEPEMTVDVRRSEFASSPVTVVVGERAGRPHVDVRCRASGGTPSIEDQAALRDAVFKAAITILGQGVQLRDAETDIEALFHDERVGDRASAFAGGLGAEANVLGSAKTSMAAWVGQEQEVPLRRTSPWAPAPSSTTRADAPLVVSKEEPPEELRDFSALDHASMATVSPIRLRLWDRAKWHAAGFIVDTSHEEPPVLALVFRDKGAATAIFEQWQKEQRGSGLCLRLTIIRGVDRLRPHSYRIMVSGDPAALPPGTKYVMAVSRSCQMDPSSSRSVDTFLAARDAVGTYLLVPGVPSSSGDDPMGAVCMSLAVKLNDIQVIEAWRVGAHDLETAGISPDDDPVIPEGVTDAPVLSVLERKRRPRT